MDLHRGYCLPQTAATTAKGEVKATFMGVSTLLFDDGGTKLMIDGFFSRHRLATTARQDISTDPAAVDPALERAGVGKLEALFVAHSHYDHAFDVAYVARKTGAQVYGSRSTLNIARGGKVDERQLTEFRPGVEYPVGRFRVTVLRGKHSNPIPGINNDIGQTIDCPLGQPASVKAYKEGGSFNFLIRHGTRSFLVIPASNQEPGSLAGVKVDVLFLSTAVLGIQTEKFREDYYRETVGTVRPELVIPIHWDNFFLPLTGPLKPLGDPSFGFLERRLQRDGIRFGILQAFQSVDLSGPRGDGKAPGARGGRGL